MIDLLLKDERASDYDSASALVITEGNEGITLNTDGPVFLTDDTLASLIYLLRQGGRRD